MTKSSTKSFPPDSPEGHRGRLCQRYAAGGITALADYEVVELLLTLLIPRVDVKPVAKRLIAEFAGLRGILDAPREELEKIDGIGANTAAMLGFLHDVIPLYLADSLAQAGREIASISMLVDYFKSRIGGERNEVLEMLCLDTKLRIIGDSSVRLVEGSVSSANVDIRRIIEVAMRCGASSFALAHNHPSGDPTPSAEDLRFTRRISEACKPISLSFIDHVIVGRGSCFSFRRDGCFDCLYDEAEPAKPARRRCRGAAETRKAISLS